MYILVQQRHPGYLYDEDVAAFVPHDATGGEDPEEAEILCSQGTGYSLMQVRV